MFLVFLIFFEIFDALEVQWYAKILYLSSVSFQTVGESNFPFQFIVKHKGEGLVNAIGVLCGIYASSVKNKINNCKIIVADLLIDLTAVSLGSKFQN